MDKKFSFKKAFFAFSFLTMLNYAFPGKANNAIIFNQVGYAKNQLKPLKGKCFEKVNYLIPYIESISKEVNVNPEHLRMIVWLESEGNPRALNFEEDYYKNCIKGKDISPLFKKIYNNLKEQGYRKDFSLFKKELSTSYGLGQILLTTAYKGGYRGIPEHLYNKKTNLKLAGKIIKWQYSETRGYPHLISTMYNTGRADGNPAKGRNSRLEYYLKASRNSY